MRHTPKHMKMYQVDLCLFHEGDDEREWFDDWYTINTFDNYDDAYDFATKIAEHKRDCVEFVIDMLSADGASIDVRECGPNPYTYSIDVIKGWPLDYWHNEECHEAKE